MITNVLPPFLWFTMYPGSCAPMSNVSSVQPWWGMAWRQISKRDFSEIFGIYFSIFYHTLSYVGTFSQLYWTGRYYAFLPVLHSFVAMHLVSSWRSVNCNHSLSSISAGSWSVVSKYDYRVGQKSKPLLIYQWFVLKPADEATFSLKLNIEQDTEVNANKHLSVLNILSILCMT